MLFRSDQLASDAIELIDYLRTRFGREKIVLVGQSWGSLLGLEVAKRAPDRLFVLATIGQATAWEEMFEYTKQSLIDLARETGDSELEAAMIATGPFPPADAEALIAAGVSRVYTPKDFDLTQIMRDVVAVVDKAWKEAA